MRYVLPALLPQVKAAFAIDNATAGLAISAIWAGYAVMQFPAGVLADHLDERTVLSLSLALAALSLGAISVAPLFGVFLGACGLFGLVTGLFGTTRGIALSNFFAPSPERAFGVALAAGSIGSAALPFLASLLVDDLGWRVVVGLSLPVFLGMAVGTWLLLPAARRTDGPEEPGISTSTVAGALGTAARDRRIIISVFALTLMLFTFQALTAFLPTYLIQEKAVSQQLAGGLFALLFVAGAGFQLVGGGAASRFGPRQVLVAVSVVGIVALGILPWVGGVVPLAVVMVVLASRLAVAPIANAYILGVLPDEATGTTWGLMRTIFFLLSSTGSAVVGALSDFGFFDEAFYLLAGLTAVAAVLFVLLPDATTRVS